MAESHVEEEATYMAETYKHKWIISANCGNGDGGGKSYSKGYILHHKGKHNQKQ